MPLAPGTQLGAFHVVELIGAGGMGEVYRARDTRLKRDVAIKVLPEAFAADAERLARSQREAEALAALNHPNVAQIHGVEHNALVLEFVDGPTLADRIAQGPLPLEEALAIAKQIAAALEAAHEHAIVHRDLKPANVKVAPDGTVKVLDFGLAKALEPTPGSGLSALGQPGADQSHSPTITSPALMTGGGVILGTAAYMSPEQAKGRPADKRCDVWAFGCVLYEMLTGKRAFDGEDVVDVLGAVARLEPDWTTIPSSVPPPIITLVRSCLIKDRRKRIADISTARFVLEEMPELIDRQPAPRTHAAEPKPRWQRIGVPAAAGLIIAIASALAGGIVWRPSIAPAPATKFTLIETGAAALNIDIISRDLTITPDGSRIVYKAAGVPGVAGTGFQLYARALDQLEPALLFGRNAPRAPFPSPDGQWIGFVEADSATVQKVSIAGGPAVPIGKLSGSSRGLTWGDDDTIIFAGVAPEIGLERVPSSGGDQRVITRPNPANGEQDHLWPQFLPGSQAVLFTIMPIAGGIDAAQIAVLDLRSGAQKVLVRGGSQAQYVGPREGRQAGYLVYVAASTLRAVPFDLERLETRGAALPVLPRVMTLPTGTAEFDVSRSGTLVYATGGAVAPRTLVWVDRKGRETTVAGLPERAHNYPRLSPDGTRVVLELGDEQNDIWVWDLARRTLERLTFDPGIDRAPVWTPDGRRLIFSSQAGGDGLFWQAADGSGSPERLTQATNAQFPSAVSPDGRNLLAWGVATGGVASLTMFSLDPERKARILLRSTFPTRNGEVSPDGRWLLYEASDSGLTQIFVRPFPDTDSERRQISTGGGSQPMWSKNGREIFYLAPDGAVMGVSVEPGDAWKAGNPERVIAGQYWTGGGAANVGRQYDVSADGQRFLMIKEVKDAGRYQPPGIVVVQNWYEELKRLVPEN